VSQFNYISPPSNVACLSGPVSRVPKKTPTMDNDAMDNRGVSVPVPQNLPRAPGHTFPHASSKNGRLVFRVPSGNGGASVPSSFPAYNSPYASIRDTQQSNQPAHSNAGSSMSISSQRAKLAQTTAPDMETSPRNPLPSSSPTAVVHPSSSKKAATSPTSKKQSSKPLIKPPGGIPPELPPSVEAAYRKKCIQLKQRMNEVEEANDASRQRLARLHRGIQKLRLERAFLLEQLAKRTSTNVEDSEGSPSPPPTVCVPHPSLAHILMIIDKLTLLP
jgi:hypothetical protein